MTSAHLPAGGSGLGGEGLPFPSLTAESWQEIKTPVPAGDVRSITPGFVRSVIEQCLRTGWVPGEPGSQF
ncbi:MAG: hypothetical protein KDA91_16470, partial [Planctomycetaceae bacterium]|nr:hypothetical protein [Planctomycetaceae bacterium]